MIRSTVTGSAELRYVAGKLRKAAARDLQVELSKAQREAFKPLAPEIRLEALAILPGGYGPTMANAVKVSVRSNLARATVTANIFARARKELRDVVAVNRGLLRHPLFGNRNRWYAQKVRAGFVTRAVNRLEDRIGRESTDALDRIVKEIAR